MHTKRLILIVLVFAASLVVAGCGSNPAPAPTQTPPPAATQTALPPTSTPKTDKQIKLIYIKANKPTAGQEIWLSYYDENTKTWVTNSATTDQAGTVIFSVPEGAAGESFTFTYAYTEADVKKHTSQIMAGQSMGMRIPPDFSQKSLTLKLFGSDVSVEEGAIQMWNPK